MNPTPKERAQSYLQGYAMGDLTPEVTFRGVRVSEFERHELLIIIQKLAHELKHWQDKATGLATGGRD